jgi:hypothetical protein
VREETTGGDPPPLLSVVGQPPPAAAGVRNAEGDVMVEAALTPKGCLGGTRRRPGF